MTRRWPIPRLAFSRRSGDGRSRIDRTAEERFRTLIAPHLDAAWTYARYLAREDHVAEDVVQEAFLRAFRAGASIQGDGRAWLMTIVRNCWHDWVRTHRPAEELTELEEPIEEETPLSLLERQSDATHVRAVLAMLPEPFRETLVLRELEELSYREIAAITGAPIGTVMSRLARGRDMLAHLMLGDDLDEPGPGRRTMP